MNSDLTLCELGPTGIPGLESFSPFCLKVHRALKAAGLPYARRHGSRPTTFRPLNPAAQVPILLVGKEPVYDSTRIVARIQALPGSRLRAPEDARHRAEATLWEELADTALNGFVAAARWADARNWPTVRQAYFGGAPAFVRALVAPRTRTRVLRALVARDVWRHGAEACWARFDELLDALDARAPADGYWVTPEALSSADLALFGQLHSLRSPLTGPQREGLARRTRLVAWLDRVDRATS